MSNKLKSYKLQAKKGFTLIETIIYMGLLAAILLVITNLLISTSYFSQEEQARLEIQKNARFATERIIRDLQITDSINAPLDANPADSLIITTITPEQIIYAISDNRLTRADLISTENITSNQVKIDSLEFRRVGNLGGKPTIKINMTVDYIGEVEGQRNISQEFSTTYSLK